MGSERAARLRRGLEVDFFRAVVAANLVGALVVGGFLILVLPAPADIHAGKPLLINLFGIALLAAAIPIGMHRGRAAAAPLFDWLSADRPPTASEQARALEYPWLGFRILGPLWLVGAVIFGIINVLSTASIEFGVVIALTILLGGATTCTLIVLWAERALRDLLAASLESTVPAEPVGPGIRTRVVLAWALGSGVPLFGVILVSAGAMLGTAIPENRMARTSVLLAILGLAVGLLAVWLAGRSIAEPVEAVRAALNEVERGNLDAEVAVSQGSEVGLLGAGFNRMAAGLRERERIRAALGTYLDPEVADHVLSKGTNLAGEEVDVTMMFVDIRDFTGFAERATAAEVVATINRLFECIVPVIHGSGGHVDKFIGDGLLAVFGAPRRIDNPADHALAAALEIEHVVAEEFGGRLSVGIGLNSGDVVAGNVGGGGRLEFSVIGDAVNVAARVEAATRATGDTILISEHTKNRLSARDHPTLEERPAVPLKGKTEPVALYAPVAATPS